MPQGAVQICDAGFPPLRHSRAMRPTRPASPCPSCRHALRLPALAALLLIGHPAAGRPDDAGKAWTAGPYSFSDELGGFRITGVSGIGTKNDPVVIRQEFESASPVTLVIRALGPVRPFGKAGVTPSGFINFRVETLNASGLGWIEFEFELQEIRNNPSVFGDGLSFDQRRSDSDSVWSDAFRHYSRDFEPYDRLLFQQGKVDPGKVADFAFLVTDFTPRATFYLVQDPRIPSS